MASQLFLALHDDHVDRGESDLVAVVRGKKETGIDQGKVLELYAIVKIC